MDVLLVRHPQVAAPPGLCYGQLDLPLLQPQQPPMADLIARAVALQAAAGGGPVQAVISSPLQRAQLLASALAAHFGAPLQPDARWQELHFGAWEGRLWADIPRHESDPWAADYHHRAPPQGETHAALSQRVRQALLGLLPAQPALAPAGPLIVVSHAGPMRCALGMALGLPESQQADVSVDLGGWLWLRAWHDGLRWRWTLKGLNR